MPFFIVESVAETIDFYTTDLGFVVEFQQTLDGDTEPSFCILGRDEVSIMFKTIVPGIHPTPNLKVHKWARWDAYIATRDPDALYDEFRASGTAFQRDLENTDDGLRAFEVRDNSGYILCFARRL